MEEDKLEIREWSGDIAIYPPAQCFVITPLSQVSKSPLRIHSIA